MKKLVKWVVVLIPFLLLGYILMNMFNIHMGRLMAGQQMFGHHGLSGMGGFGHGMRGHGFSGGMYIAGFPLFIFALLFKAGLVLAGWAIWKKANGMGGRLAGGILFTLAAYSILPKLLGIPFVILMAYLAFKFFANKEVPAHSAANGYYGQGLSHTPLNKTGQYLDEWEKSIRKEDI